MSTKKFHRAFSVLQPCPDDASRAVVLAARHQSETDERHGTERSLESNLLPLQSQACSPANPLSDSWAASAAARVLSPICSRNWAAWSFLPMNWLGRPTNT